MPAFHTALHLCSSVDCSGNLDTEPITRMNIRMNIRLNIPEFV